jgi:phosphopantetheine--protein transferase-like protein
MKVFIGNDIVDLTNPDIENKHNKRRFIRRVLSSYEMGLFESSENKKLTLWTLWSGKEAAYKVLKKLIPDMVFAHSKVIVDLDFSSMRGSVIYNEYVISLRWTVSDEWVHCVAVLKGDEKSLGVFEYDVKELDLNTKLHTGFSKDESASIYSIESAGVRNLSKLLLGRYGLAQIEIVRRPLLKKFAPPEIMESGSPLKYWDLSMSHDGKYISCAISKSDSKIYAC